MSIIEQIIVLVAPHLCVGCPRPGRLLCQNCLDLAVIPGEIAGHKSSSGQELLVVAPYLYQGQIKDLLWRYKFGHGRAAAELMASEVMIQLTANYDLVTFVPTAGRRRRQRGYDQAQLLAKAVARRLGRPCRPLLKRQGQARQVGATRKQRLIQAQKSYSYAGPDLTDQQVLLVDDVISTGATVTACADLLLANGAAQVDIAAFAIKS